MSEDKYMRRLFLQEGFYDKEMVTDEDRLREVLGFSRIGLLRRRAVYVPWIMGNLCFACAMRCRSWTMIMGAL